MSSKYHNYLIEFMKGKQRKLLEFDVREIVYFDEEKDGRFINKWSDKLAEIVYNKLKYYIFCEEAYGLHSESCPFCIKQKITKHVEDFLYTEVLCEDCEYAINHGICDEKNSTYNIVTIELLDSEYIFSNEFYKKLIYKIENTDETN